MSYNYYPTLVLGSGIASLGEAYKLFKEGEDFLILEKDKQAGGVLKSIEHKGFTLDLAANSFSATPYFLQFLHEIGLENALLEANTEAKNRAIYSQNQLHVFGFSPQAVWKSTLLSRSEKWRGILEPFIPTSKKEDETVYQFFERRLGRGITNKLVNPAIRGIYADDISNISMKLALPELWLGEKKYGSLFSYMSKKKKSKLPSERSIYSINGGMSVIGAAAKTFFAKKLRLNTEITEIKKNGAYWEIKAIERGIETFYTCKRIICGIPAHTSAQLFTSEDHLKSVLKNVEWIPLSLLYVAFPKDKITVPNAFGCLIPTAEKWPFMGIIFNSRIFNFKAPENTELFTVFHQLNGDEKEVWSVIKSDFEKIIPFSEEPIMLKQHHWEKALPKFNAELQASIKKLEWYKEDKPSAVFVGNYMGNVSLAKLFEGKA